MQRYGGESYLAEVHDRRQVEDILDERLGTIERWRLEESYTLGHVVDEPNPWSCRKKEGAKTLELRWAKNARTAAVSSPMRKEPRSKPSPTREARLASLFS
jgi:hypothetical protein